MAGRVITAPFYLVDIRHCHDRLICADFPDTIRRVGSRYYTTVIDCRDPAALGRWWAKVLDWQVVYEADDEVVVARDDNTYPGLVFVPVPEPKTVKNRLHIDLAPDDRDAEVERIAGLGATRIDIGQGDDKTWVVLADPEGNEFCVLRTREGGV